MNQQSNQFPHIELKFAAEGVVRSTSFPREKSQTTQAKLGDRFGHGSTLKNSISGIISDWQQHLVDRQQQQQPDLPAAVPFILQIDPTAFEAENLRKFGIEVIAELENGYILGASADLQLTELQKKIENFIKAERGGGKVSEIWDIIDNLNRPEYILSPELQAEWSNIQDAVIYTVDIGVSCIGEKSKLRDYPKRENFKSDENFIESIRKWIGDRDISFQEWDDLKLQRENEFELFVWNYQGNILHNVDGELPTYSKLPDSFSCRISISGKGLKDIVFNFPYVFDVSLPDEINTDAPIEPDPTDQDITFTLEPPDSNAPKVCIIDSGIQEKHPLLRSAIATADSKSWVPNELDLTADTVLNGGHGTPVAGAVLYPQQIPTSGQSPALCWLQNARVLDRNNRLPEALFPPTLIANIVSFYQTKTNTRIFNHSITGSTPCRTQYMSAWAAEIDNLSYQQDILFIVAAGNLPINEPIGKSRQSIQNHLQKPTAYPDYLLENSCRVANPAQSFQALTVGSVSLHTLNDLSKKSIAPKDYPSSFSCTGLGIWDSIKPEVVEYGGDLVTDDGTPPSLSSPPAVCPELVLSTLGNGPATARDRVGTSYATPKVTHIAARLAAEFPKASCLLYRALIVQSARFPNWVETEGFDLDKAIRLMGYGIPDLDRAIGGSSHRITLTSQGDRNIAARQAHIYEVSLPNELRSPGEDQDIRIEVTLSYKAQPRRTRRAHRKYLSTWLDWECSKKGEDSDRLLERVLQNHDAPDESEKGESMFGWVIGKQKNHGQTRRVSRQAGTIQKDWAVVKSYDLRESFCIAVIGHEGWNNDPNATASYALVVSFEAVNTDIPIYTEIAKVQIPIEVESEVAITI